MATPALAAPTTIALLPRDEHRLVPIGVVAELLARAIDRTRYTDSRIVDAVSAFFDAHAVVLPRGQSAERVTDAVMILVFADQVYDSEYDQARRAVTAVLGELFPSGALLASGWMNGHQVIVAHQRHRLTGEACPRCEVNPECSSPGGGTHCLDTTGCRWSFCD